MNTLHPFAQLSNQEQVDFLSKETQERRDLLNKMRSTLIPFLNPESMQISCTAHDMYRYINSEDWVVLSSEESMDEYAIWLLLERQKCKTYNLFGGEKDVIIQQSEDSDLLLIDMLGFSLKDSSENMTESDQELHSKRMENLKIYDNHLREAFTYCLHLQMYKDATVAFDFYLNEFLDGLLGENQNSLNPLGLTKEELYKLYTRKLIYCTSKGCIDQSTPVDELPLYIKVKMFGLMRDLYSLEPEHAFNEFESTYEHCSTSGVHSSDYIMEEHKGTFELNFCYVQSPEAGGHYDSDPQELLDMMQQEVSNNFSDLIWNGNFKYDEDAEVYCFSVIGSVLNTSYIEQDLHNIIDSCLWQHGVSFDVYDLVINEELYNV